MVGEVKYSIGLINKMLKTLIYMHITGKKTNKCFFRTDILSASGTASGYQTYESSFDFGGSLTSIIIGSRYKSCSWTLV